MAYGRLEKIAVGWCRLMHADISWPMHGRYQCITCKRYYRVPWEEDLPADSKKHRKPVAQQAADTVKPVHAA